MIIGDMDSVTDDALPAAPRWSCTPTRTGARPGWPGSRTSASPAVTFPAAATSEDVAMLLADEKGAALIVAVGTHATLVEFLDKGRGGMASTFLTRLRRRRQAGRRQGRQPALPQPISAAALLLLVLAALIAVASAAGRVGDRPHVPAAASRRQLGSVRELVQGLFS